MPDLEIAVPYKYGPLFTSSKRYKAMRGGRGAGRSWAAATALLTKARQGYERILCTREYQATIRESVHYLLRDRINEIGLGSEFYVTDTFIRHRATDSEFIYKGLRHDPEGVKSLENITKVWIEEARTVSKQSLIILDPTIRATNSEIWATWNPEQEKDPIEEFFRQQHPEDVDVIDASWRDNPFFPIVLERQRSRAEELANQTGDWSAYDWIWEGKFRRISDAIIFSKRVVVEEFETPADARFYHGADWGFANDPTALVRSYITQEPDGKHLWIDREAFGYGIEINELPQLFRSIPTSAKWPIYADNARPETISAMKKEGFNISAAEKWSGSIEDGITYLKGFVKIHVHARCKHMIEEAKLYSYKVDKLTQEVLPIVVDANNHGWDAMRYAHDRLIHQKKPLVIPESHLAVAGRR